MSGTQRTRTRDPLGVTSWRFGRRDGRHAVIFKRPPHMLPVGSLAYMIRQMDGEAHHRTEHAAELKAALKLAREWAHRR